MEVSLFSGPATVPGDLRPLLSPQQFLFVGTIIFLLQMEKPSTEKLSALSQVTQQVNGEFEIKLKANCPSSS